MVHDLNRTRGYAQATLIEAVEDFPVGPEVLDDGGVEALRAVRALRSRSSSELVVVRTRRSPTPDPTYWPVRTAGYNTRPASGTAER